MQSFISTPTSVFDVAIEVPSFSGNARNATNGILFSRSDWRQPRKPRRHQFDDNRLLHGLVTMLRVALTGGIATGKSHVLKLLAARDIPTIDADQVAREVVQPGRKAWFDIRKRFGAQVFSSDGSLERAYLAALVFSDVKARYELQAIVHPHVRRRIDDWFHSLHTENIRSFAVAEIPLLFETKRETEFDWIIVTVCEPDIQKQRLIERQGLSDDDAQKRIDAQLPVFVKSERANSVIRTDGTFGDTERQVEDVCNTLTHQH